MNETEQWAADCQRQFRAWEVQGQRLQLSPQQLSFHYMQMRIVKNTIIMHDYSVQLQQENLLLQQENSRAQATLHTLLQQIRMLSESVDENFKIAKEHEEELEESKLAFADTRTRLECKISTLKQRAEAAELQDKSDDDCRHMRYMYLSDSDHSQEWETFSAQKKYRYLSEMNKHMATWIEAVGYKPVFEVHCDVLLADVWLFDPDHEDDGTGTPCVD